MNQSVYVLESESGLVKIGVAADVTKRAAAISTQSGFKIKNQFQTQKCDNAFEIEHALHEFFKEQRIHGEWFKIHFSDAVRQTEALFEKLHKSVGMKSNYDPIFLYCAMHYHNDILSVSRNLCTVDEQGRLCITVVAVRRWLQLGAPTLFLPPLKDDMRAQLLEYALLREPEHVLCFFTR